MSDGVPPNRPNAPERPSAPIGIDARTETLLRRLVRREADGALKKLLARCRPQDVAAVMEHLTFPEQRRLYRAIEDRDQAAEVLSYLSEGGTRELTRDMSQEVVVDLLERMGPDDATDIVAGLPDELRAKVLAEIEGDPNVGSVRTLLAWPAESAGGLMSPRVFTMPLGATCGQAIASLQSGHEDLENIYYVYVVDPAQRLVGVTSLRGLLTHSPRAALEDVMTRDPLTVPPKQDQEEVARIVARYDLLAVPVVDEDRRILGIVTVDDVIDVIRDEAAEDMMLMAGVPEPEPEQSTVRQAAYRASWLTATILGGIGAAEIIAHFEGTLAAKAVLAGFIPVIMGLGGNVGIQSATLAVRGLATGTIQVGGALRFIVNEARVGLAMGGLFATVLLGYTFFRFMGDPMVGVAVGTSVFAAMSLASVIGSTLPIALKRFGADPAVATGPIVTTLVDLLAIVVYFNVARLLLGL